QDFLIQLVGLRGNALLLPFILFGAALDATERDRLALWLAALNIIAFVFAVAEFSLGLEPFFPRSPVTELIYQRPAVADYTALRLGWLAAASVVAWVVSSDERLQRFTTLWETEEVVERIAGSVNMTFVEIAQQFPFGNGLGGGGTSIPHFLQPQINYPVSLEN